MEMVSLVKKAVAVTALASACVAVNADTIKALGPIAVGVPKIFDGLVASGPFVDMLTFVLPPNGGSGYSVAKLSLLPSFLDIANGGVSVFADPDGVAANGDEIFIKSGTSSNGSSIDLTIPGNGGGYGILVISGEGVGSAGGIYFGAISVSAVSAVPEPESYAMLLAGLGVMGAIAVRRRKSKSE